jgi:hypothetical protein
MTTLGVAGNRDFINAECQRLERLMTTLSSDNYSSPSTTTIIPDLPSIAANVNDNYFSRSAGQLILPGRSVARYGSRAG